MRFTLLILSVLFPISLNAQQIILNEDYSDWALIDTLHYYESDEDIELIKMTNDDRFLYLYIKLAEEINLQNSVILSIFIDTDNNSTTGNSGFDFEFNFGERTGFYHGNYNASINAYQVGLVSSPTVSSSEFEIIFDLESTLNGEFVFTSQTIPLAITYSGEIENIPTIVYDFIQSDYDEPEYFLAKSSKGDLRIMAYNVRGDNLFNPDVEDHFRRIFRAIKPDIIGLSEVYENSGSEAAQLIESMLPSTEGEQWYSGDTGNDNLMVSRYPVIEQTSINGNAAYLLDLGDHELFTIVAHPPCCSNDERRQDEIDAMMAFVRDSKNGGGFDISENTPIVIMGDMNLVGLSQQQSTILSGDIVNESSYGNDFTPDWDGTDFDDTIAPNPGLPTTFTWYSSRSSFSAGRLDYIVYSGSVLELTNSFSLHSPALPSDTLNTYNLNSDDTIIASDHLPVVADFRLPESTSVDVPLDGPQSLNLDQNYPNPFNPTTTITFELNESTELSLTVFDSSGKKISSVFENEIYVSGKHSINFDATNLASGVYIYQLSSDHEIITKKMVLIK